MKIEDPVWVVVRADIGDEMVVLDADVLGSRPQARGSRNLKASGVVLEAFRVDLGLGQLHVEIVTLDLGDEV